MKKFFVVIFLGLTAFACREKKKSTVVNEKMITSDFINAFSALKLPFTVTDSTLADLKTDTTTISRQALLKFVPDTALPANFSKDPSLIVHPIGKQNLKGKETYLLVKAQSKNKAGVFLFVFDEKEKFRAAMPLITTRENNDTTNSASFDNRFAISKNKEWKSNDELVYKRTIYAYNNAGGFTLVMTETNDQSAASNKLLNPIDTLARKNKYSGDYWQGKRSIVSIRDGKTANDYRFYVHFENEVEDDQPCTGDLRGEFVLKTPTTAVFSESNDPCVIDFTFSGNQVKVKEQGTCGSHRGIKCFFNDTYTRKKEAKPKKKNKS